MNSVNSEGHLANGQFSYLAPTPYAYGPARTLGTDKPVEELDAEQRFRKNRADSLELCDAFQAFYGSNPAYHLDL